LQNTLQKGGVCCFCRERSLFVQTLCCEFVTRNALPNSEITIWPSDKKIGREGTFDKKGGKRNITAELCYRIVELQFVSIDNRINIQYTEQKNGHKANPEHIGTT